MGEEKRLLLWGGLAGMLHPVFLILAAVTLFGFVPRAPAGLHGLVMRYPDARVAFEVGETFSLVSGILAVPYSLALFQALRRKFGKRFGTITIVLALGGLTGLYALGIDSIVFAAFGLSVFIVLPLLFGWKLYRLSRAA